MLAAVLSSVWSFVAMVLRNVITVDSLQSWGAGAVSVSPTAVFFGVLFTELCSVAFPSSFDFSCRKVFVRSTLYLVY